MLEDVVDGSTVAPSIPPTFDHSFVVAIYGEMPFQLFVIRCKFGKLFSQYFTTEAVGSHNYQCTYSLLFDWQGELLLPLTDILFVYLPSDS